MNHLIKCQIKRKKSEMTDIINNIKQLREITGAGFIDCKIALEKSNNEIEK